MNNSEYINEEELLSKAISILTEKLGPLETSRFLSISGKRRSESVKRHRKWQKDLNKNELFKDLFNK
jgi:hypothetical protein